MNYNRQNTSPKVRFIYSDSPNYRLSPSRPPPLDQSITTHVVPFQSRPVSLPARKQEAPNIFQQEQQNHISIVEDSLFTSKRTRRRKIFEESSFMGRQSLSQQKRRRSQRIFGENSSSGYKSPPKQVQPPADNLMKIQQVEIKNIQFTNPKQFTMSKPPVVEKPPLKETVSKDREIKKAVQQSGAQTLNPLPTSNSIQIQQKEQQINYLKLQVERLKRCQKISKENECLYKRLSQKIKSQVSSISMMQSRRKQQQSKRYSDKKVHHNHRQTPINSLSDLQKAEQSPSKVTAQFIDDKKLKIEVQTEPLKYDQNQLKKQGKIVGDSGISLALTFNQTKQGRGRSHSKRINVENTMNMTQIQQRILNSTKNRKQISQVAVSHRLQEINGQLQRKMASISRARSRSRPHKQNLIEPFPVGGATLSAFYPTNIKHLMYMY